ncbi:hypothetical protein [Arthrobacter sp. SLBN-112]|uniref:hypothetical protein n=1 Tax=Arthrobacter sp. SLBN-112 TaxID=2768452 RepID=UPI0027AEF0C6|nr:hypothetical protein [Arthrobacter sp. SLBN-112]MDQ0800293.1 hypothetical protein [Arthrobacter sp. SLBN-112]
MEPERPVFRRADGAPYDPNPVNVRQYEEEYGPGGVPEGYSMAATTPLQNPGAIIGAGIFVVAVSGFMFLLAFTAAGSGSAPHVPVVATIVGVLGLLSAAWAFVIAGRRRRWLRDRAKGSEGQAQTKIR